MLLVLCLLLEPPYDLAGGQAQLGRDGEDGGDDQVVQGFQLGGSGVAAGAAASPAAARAARRTPRLHRVVAGAPTGHPQGGHSLIAQWIMV